jgi:hypothetical protein
MRARHITYALWSTPQFPLGLSRQVLTARLQTSQLHQVSFLFQKDTKINKQASRISQLYVQVTVPIGTKILYTSMATKHQNSYNIMSQKPISLKPVFKIIFWIKIWHQGITESDIQKGQGNWLLPIRSERPKCRSKRVDKHPVASAFWFVILQSRRL